MRLFLHIGDQVRHTRKRMWGLGEVIEEMHSSLDGGTCIVRILFEDGKERSFINDMDNSLCCYYAGIRQTEFVDL